MPSINSSAGGCVVGPACAVSATRSLLLLFFLFLFPHRVFRSVTMATGANWGWDKGRSRGLEGVVKHLSPGSPPPTHPHPPPPTSHLHLQSAQGGSALTTKVALPLLALPGLTVIPSAPGLTDNTASSKDKAQNTHVWSTKPLWTPMLGYWHFWLQMFLCLGWFT